MNTDSLKNIDAEIAVLGGCLLDNNTALSKAIKLSEADFVDIKHRSIWSAIKRLYQRNEPVDLVTLTAELKGQDTLKQAGGNAYLAETIGAEFTTANIHYYINLIRDCAARRKLANIGQEIAAEALNAANAGEAVDKAESLVMELRSRSQHQGSVPVSDLMATTLRNLERLNTQGGGVRGVQTGFPQLDSMTCGLQPGDLIIVAGRPSMGKTALALNIAENAAREEHKTMIFSLEMSKELLINRLLSGAAKVNANLFRNGRFKAGDWPKLTEAAADINGLPIIIDDRSGVTVLDIRAAARQEQRKSPLGLIVIDYLQLLRPAKSQQAREREVAEMSRSLKALAKELHIPVVVLAQLNRKSEDGGKLRRPVPSDLRESGSLEQDADLILFPWREAAYCEACKQRGGDCGKNHYHAAEIIIGKQRNGPTGIIKAAWLGEFTKFLPTGHTGQAL